MKTGNLTTPVLVLNHVKTGICGLEWHDELLKYNKCGLHKTIITHLNELKLMFLTKCQLTTSFHAGIQI